MNITIKHNTVFLENVKLGKSFADIVADLIVDKYGRVKIITNKTSFYTDLDNLPYETLNAIARVLEKRAKNKILEMIQAKVKSSIRISEEKQKIV